MMSEQRGFFDLDERYQRLSEAGDPLERLLELVDFEMFRGDVEKALSYRSGVQGGRPPLDAIMMFKVLVLQSLYGLSDPQAEYQILDRRSFGRFLGLDDGDRVPDETTIWRYREGLTKAGVIQVLFERFDTHLKHNGYLAMGGQIVDASIVHAPRQRMTDEEKEIVKDGGIPENWRKKPRKLAQKDRDARWMVKYSKAKADPAKPDAKRVDIAVPMFGYKDHIAIDRTHGFIRKYTVTDASRYDGHELENLLDKDNTASRIWADTAYGSKKNRKMLDKHKITADIHTRKPRGKPMSDRARQANSRRSKIRSFVEHPFAHMKGPMRLFIRTIGMERAKTKIGMTNLAYNFRRYMFHQRKRA